MKIAYDCSQDRPACVLVAAGLGADSSLASRFPTKSWLLAPTPDMGVYEVSEAELKILVDRNWERHNGNA